MNIEYELQKPNFELHNVKISIPYPTSVPTINEFTGNYFIDKNKKTLDWQLALIDDSNAQGSLEFTCSSDDVGMFFPVKVSFTSKTSFCGVDVENVVDFNDQSEIPHSKTVVCLTEEYSVV